MPSPVGLNATPMDEEVYLEWREPGGMTFYDIAYYDEEFEGQIGCEVLANLRFDLLLRTTQQP